MELRAISSLLLRFWLEYRQVWRALLIRDVLDRLLFLFAFGFGFGAVIRELDGGYSYLAFLATGIVCSSPMMTMTMAGTFGAFERIHSTRVWQSWLTTPIRLNEILLAELLYANFRSMPSVFILIALAALVSDLPNPLGIFMLLPFLMLANLAYGAVALCFTAHINRALYFSFVNTLWMTPMFLFSGVFFDLTQTPAAMQWLAQVFPLTHVLSVVRPVLLSQPMPWVELLAATTALLVMFGAAFVYASYKLHQKLLS